MIRGFSLDVDPAAIGLAGRRVGADPPRVPVSSRAIADLAARTPEVSECHRISGEDCFLLKVHAATIADLEPRPRPVPGARAHDELVRRFDAGPADVRFCPGHGG